MDFFFKIGSNIFVTAAHCLHDWHGFPLSGSEMKIILGALNRRELPAIARLYKNTNITI